MFLFLKLIQMFQDRQKMFLGRFQYDKKLFLCYFQGFPVREHSKSGRSFAEVVRIGK